MSRINLASAFVDLTLEDGRFGPRLAAVEKTMRGFQQRMESVGRFARNALLGMGAGLVFAAREAAQAEAAMAKLEAALKATGGAAGLSADQIATFAKELEQTTTFDDDKIIEAAAAIARMENISGENFKEALKAAADLAAATGDDLTSAALQLAKALNQPADKYKSLSRAGIQFTETQEEAIAAFVKVGDVTNAQRIILEEYADTVGGTALANTKTFGGAMLGLWRSIKQTAEVIGFAFVPYLNAGAGIINGMLPAVQKWVKENADIVVKLTATAAGLLAVAYVLPKVTALVSVLSTAITFLAANPLVVVLGGLATFAAYMAYTSAEGETFAEKMEDIQQRLTGMFAPIISAFDTAFTFIANSLDTVRFAFQSFETSGAIALTQVKLFAITAYEDIKFFFGSQIPDIFRYVSEFIGNTLYNTAQYGMTVVRNFADNISQVFVEVFDYIESLGEDPIQFNFTPLTQGFEKAAMVLPEIAKREMSEAERETQAALDQLRKELEDEQNEAQRNRERGDNRTQKRKLDQIRQEAAARNKAATTQVARPPIPPAPNVPEVKQAFVGLEEAFRKVQESALASVARAHLAVSQQQLGEQQRTADAADAISTTNKQIAAGITELNTKGFVGHFG